MVSASLDITARGAGRFPMILWLVLVVISCGWSGEPVLLQFDKIKELLEGVVESFAVKGEWRVDADGDSKGADFIAVLRG